MAPAEGARSVTGTPVAARRRPPGIVGVVLTTTLLPDVECHEMTVTKRGRPPIGAVAMTAAERKRRQRDRMRGRRDVLDRDRDRKRDERAAERAAGAADRPAEPVRPADLVEYVEALTVTQGEHEGELLEVLPWQRAFLERVEAAGGGELGLSVAAGAGKTTLLAAVAAAGVAGPLTKPRAAVVLVAGSFAQATIGFDTALAFLQPTIDADPDRWRVNRSASAALIEDRETGAELRAREASARTLHGSAPSLVIADEPAQMMPTQRDQLYAALRSRLGKIPGARLVAIGTRPDDPAHWFSRLLHRGGTTYQADPDADPYDPETWHAANPSLRHFPSLLAVYQREADEARADASLLPGFKALRLNAGTADHEIAVLIEAAAWERAEVGILPAAKGPCCWGVDLSGGDAMAAIAAYWPTTGRCEALGCFPELPSLAERGRVDGADYLAMHAAGDLLILGRRVVPVDGLVETALERWGRPARIIADYHAERELRQALESADFPLVQLVTASMGGLKDSPGRVRDFRRSVGGGRLFVKPTLLIRQALGNARTISDSMGEERLVKGGAAGRKRTARDDVAVAIVAAVSEGARKPATQRRRRHYVA